MTHSVYVIAWPDDVWKAGVSYVMPKRMAQFYGHPVLVDRFDFRDRADAKTIEWSVLGALASLGKPAFHDAREARNRLARGCGWSECYRLPTDLGGDADRSRFWSCCSAHCLTWTRVLSELQIEVDWMPTYVPSPGVPFSEYDRSVPLLHVALGEVV